MELEKELTEREKQSLTNLYEAALQQHRRSFVSSTEDVYNEFTPFLVKENASRAEYAFVSDVLTKSRLEYNKYSTLNILYI